MRLGEGPSAKMLGITERMIGYKIKKHGIKREVSNSETKAESNDD